MQQLHLENKINGKCHYKHETENMPLRSPQAKKKSKELLFKLEKKMCHYAPLKKEEQDIIQYFIWKKNAKSCYKHAHTKKWNTTFPSRKPTGTLIIIIYIQTRAKRNVTLLTSNQLQR